MKKNILGENQIMNMEFQIDKTEMIHLHQSVEILYVLEGNPEITVQDNTYQAHPEDVLVLMQIKSILTVRRMTLCWDVLRLITVCWEICWIPARYCSGVIPW